jgi:hypothetical protein
MMDAEFLSCGKPEAEKQSHPQILHHQQTSKTSSKLQQTSDQAGFDPMGAKDFTIMTHSLRETLRYLYFESEGNYLVPVHMYGAVIAPPEMQDHNIIGICLMIR